MTDAEGLGLAREALALLPHDPRWPRAFARLRAALAPLLPDGAALHHIGSTAVAELPAKPILDIGAEAAATDHAAIVAMLTARGWIDRGERSGRLLIRLDGARRTHNLHLYPTGSAELAAQIAFRDALRRNPDLRAAYAEEKRRIVTAGTARRDYAEAKTGFIAAALERYAAQ